MAVEAECADCGDVHPLGDRGHTPGTTTCPRCGSTRYDTSPTNGAITKPERERIIDAVRDVDGVGPEMQEAIVGAFGHFPAFESAGPDELEAVPGVGPQTARRIVEAR